jgi:hypothetical protein
VSQNDTIILGQTIVTHPKNDLEKMQFRATAGEAQGLGTTPRDALEALMKNIQNDIVTPIIIWPFNQGDEFFTESQHQRLQELKAQRSTLTLSEKQELEQLVEAAFDATIARTQKLQRIKS